MEHLKLLLVLQLVVLVKYAYASHAEHAAPTPQISALQLDATKGGWPAVGWGLHGQGAILAYEARQGVTVMTHRNLQQSGSEAGRVVGWGTLKIQNYVPTDVSQQGATEIAIMDGGTTTEGINTFLALLSNQSVVMWGGSNNGPSIPANGTANVTAIAAGFRDAIVLLSNGTVAPLFFGPDIPSVAQSEVDAIWAGADTYFARLRNGSLAAWRGAEPTVNITQPASSSDNITSVAVGVCGSSSSCWFTLRANGSVIPEHGVSVVPDVLQSKVTAIGGTNIESVVNVFLALLSNGSIVQWSYASPDQLGVVLLPFNTTGATFKSIAWPNWAITTTGTVVSWDKFSLNDTSNSVPFGLQDGASIRSIVIGVDMSLAMKQPGPFNVVAFNGQVIGPASESIPAGVSTAVVTQVAAGDSHAIALQNDGRVVVWGDSSFGQLSVPQDLASGGVKQVAAASDYCLAVNLQGDLYAWGDQSPVSGGPIANVTVIPRDARFNVAKVAAGAGCVLALLNNGSVAAWGSTPDFSHVQAVPAAAAANVSDISVDAGCGAAIAILKNGSVIQWGANSTTPQLENVVSAAINAYWAAAVLKNGSMVMWPVTSDFPPFPANQTFAPSLNNAQKVVLSDYVPLAGTAVAATGSVLLQNGTLVPVPFACSLAECNSVPPAAQSGVLDMAIGGAFYLAVTTSSATSTPIGPTPKVAQSASISFVLAMPASSSLASNTTLRLQFNQQLRAAMETYFNVSTVGVTLNVSSNLQSASAQQVSLTVPVNITATWQAGDTTTPAFLQQQVSQLQQRPAAVLPAALTQTYGIDASKVTISGLRTSNLAQISTPSTSPTQSPVVPPPGGTVAAPSPPVSDKLSKGALAGIIVACVIGVAAVVALTVVMYRRQKLDSANSSMIIPPMGGGFTGVSTTPAEPVKIAGLPQGELFVLATAKNYTWIEATALAGPIQAIEAGVNDTQLDKMLQGESNSSQAAAAPLHCPAVQLSKDELRQQVQLLSDGLLGRGATALVFKCVWPSRFGPNALLAAKVLHNGFESDMSVLSSFAYEAKLLAGIQHPHVVKLYGYCLDPPTVCLILELLPCSLKDVLYKAPSEAASSRAASSQATGSSASNPQSLRQHGVRQLPMSPVSQTRSSNSIHGPIGSSETEADGVSTDGTAEPKANNSVASKSSVHPLKPVMLPQIVRMCTDIAAGLAYLHSQPAPLDGTGQRPPTSTTRDGRIVHRDMKPANILLNSQGVAKISDFGLARQHDHTTFATINLGAGTLPYMAPELLISSKAGVSGAACTNRVDIYSLGIIMWELLMGQPPWRGMSTAAIMAAVINRRRLPLPGEGQSQDREHATLDVPLVDALPAHSHPDLPKMCQIIQACWQHRELRRPTAAALYGTLSALLQQVAQQRTSGN